MIDTHTDAIRLYINNLRTHRNAIERDGYDTEALTSAIAAAWDACDAIDQAPTALAPSSEPSDEP